MLWVNSGMVVGERKDWRGGGCALKTDLHSWRSARVAEKAKPAAGYFEILDRIRNEVTKRVLDWELNQKPFASIASMTASAGRSGITPTVGIHGGGVGQG